MLEKTDIPVNYFSNIKEIEDPKKLTGDEKYFLMGENIISQKYTKKSGDLVTIYKVIKVDKKNGMVYYVPKTYKLVD